MTLVQSEPKKIYIWVAGQPITTPGIYWSEADGLISLSSNGTTWYTIADKNLGATTVWNSIDTLSEANCGKYYQRGNNYGFPWAGTVTTSSTKVDATNYGPGNYYSSSTFITAASSPYKWDSSDNANLRGYTTGTNEAMRGPCDEGYHIPTYSELISIKNIWIALGGVDNDGVNFSKVLKMPFAGGRDYSSNVSNQGITALMWSATQRNAINAYGIGLLYISPIAQGKCYGGSIRPFKNEAVQPDEGWTRLDV